MVLDLVRQGRVYLERGHLVRAKGVCQQIALYLDYYLITDEDWKVVDTFLKEVLLVQKVAEWKEKGREEYQILEELARQEVSQEANPIDWSTLEKYL
jgi:hypothetical protein